MTSTRPWTKNSGHLTLCAGSELINYAGRVIAKFQAHDDLDYAHRAVNTYQAIKDALGTDEDGEALVEVARNAHRAEQKLAFLKLSVIVEVSGGVAEVTECPPEVNVEIIDHDNLEAEEVAGEIGVPPAVLPVSTHAREDTGETGTTERRLP